LPVERMRRPAAAIGPNWLAIMTGRAQEDAGWPGGEHPGLWGERLVWREVQSPREKRCLLGRFDCDIVCRITRALGCEWGEGVMTDHQGLFMKL
jgi:hypothetical protein